jgi:hypothetical protein
LDDVIVFNLENLNNLMELDSKEKNIRCCGARITAREIDDEGDIENFNDEDTLTTLDSE